MPSKNKKVAVDLAPNLHSSSPSKPINSPKSIIVDIGPDLYNPDAESNFVVIHCDTGPIKQTDTVRLLHGLAPEQSTYNHLMKMLPKIRRSRKVNPINTDATEYSASESASNSESESELSIESKESPKRSPETLNDILDKLETIIKLSDAAKDVLAQENITTAENLNFLLSFLKRNDDKNTSKFKVIPLLDEKNVMQLIKIVSSVNNDQLLIGNLKLLLAGNGSSINHILGKLESLVDQKKPITRHVVDTITDSLSRRGPSTYSPEKAVASPTALKKRAASPADAGSETPTKIRTFRI